MPYEPIGLYPMGYDSHGMQGAAYGEPANMFLPPAPSSLLPNASEVSVASRFDSTALLCFHFRTSTNKRSTPFFATRRHRRTRKTTMATNRIETITTSQPRRRHRHLGIDRDLVNVVVETDAQLSIYVAFLLCSDFLSLSECVFCDTRRKIYLVEKASIEVSAGCSSPRKFQCKS